jgi:hypothetical protein
MRADNNRSHPLFAHPDVISKNHYLHVRMQIEIFKYEDAVNNHICIPVIYIICCIYLTYIFN